MTKTFVWCPAHALLRCQEWWPVPHAHIAIRGVESTGMENMPNCTGALLEVAFQDLDPATIRKSPLYAAKPEKGDELIETCMKEAHAAQIAAFVAATPDDKLIVVNCAGGVSRSPGVVLALRRRYGGDTEEVFKKAHPNIHVASTLGLQLGVGPFQARQYEGVANPFADDQEGLYCQICKGKHQEAAVVVCPDELAKVKLQRGIMKDALEKIVRMDAVTEDERAYYWSDRAERMRDTAMIALGGEKAPPLSQLLETARRGLSYIQYGSKDFEDAKRAAEHALKWMPLEGTDSAKKQPGLCPKCEASLSSPGVRRCVNGHDF